jgi:hypothetical protein
MEERAEVHVVSSTMRRSSEIGEQMTHQPTVNDFKWGDITFRQDSCNCMQAVHITRGALQEQRQSSLTKDEINSMDSL